MKCTFSVNRFRYNHRDMFRIRCRSVGGESPVGSRFDRGEPMPDIKDAYDTEAEAEAEEAAAEMQEYHDRFEAKRGKRKRRRR